MQSHSEEKIKTHDELQKHIATHPEGGSIELGDSSICWGPKLNQGRNMTYNKLPAFMTDDGYEPLDIDVRITSCNAVGWYKRLIGHVFNIIAVNKKEEKYVPAKQTGTIEDGVRIIKFIHCKTVVKIVNIEETDVNIYEII